MMRTMQSCTPRTQHFSGTGFRGVVRDRLQSTYGARTQDSARVTAIGASRTDTLKRLLKQPGILQGPCCHDALSAKLIEDAGFPFAFMSGFCTAGAKLGAPDTGLISYGEMVDQGRYIHEATRRMPIIGDGDTGYGNALNVKRTVKGYAAAGFAGVLIEDQVSPKSCGHVRGKKVVDRAEAVSRIKAAVDARNEGADILIVARTDARQAVSLDEALARAAAFADAGADVLFIDALESRGEMSALCGLGGNASRVPKMASMLEGGGKTPMLSPEVLEAMGFKLVAYPLSLLGVSIRAMQKALQGLKVGNVPSPEAMGSFQDIQAAVGFPDYYREEERYAIPGDSASGRQASTRQNESSSSNTPDSTKAQWRSAPPSSSAAPTQQPSTPQWGGASASGQSPSRPAQPPPAASSPAPAAGSRRSSWSRSGGVPFGTVQKPGVESVAGQPAQDTAAPPSAAMPAQASASGTTSDTSRRMPHTMNGDATAGPEVVEPDQVLEAPGTAKPGSYLRQTAEPSPPVSRDQTQDSRLRGATLRVRITDSQTGIVKLETKIPAAFLSGVAAIVPQVSGMDLQALLDRALKGNAGENVGKQVDGSMRLVNFDSGIDVVQVFLEM